jgi:microcystin synthetase protein McyJ
MPSPITNTIADLYTYRHQFRGEVYGETLYGNLGYWPRPGMTIEEACDALTDLVATAAQLGPGDRVLEAGCGYGASAVHYTRRYQPAAVTGIDATDVRIQAGKDYIAASGLADTIQIGLGDATALAFPEAAFTKVLAIECAFHFDTRRAFLHEAARVLVPGGRLALADYLLRPGIDPERYLEELYPTPTLRARNVPDNFHDAAVYTTRLHEAGFEHVAIEPITDQSISAFSRYLEELGQRTPGELGKQYVDLALRHRHMVEAGIEYVLVAAQRKAK